MLVFLSIFGGAVVADTGGPGENDYRLDSDDVIAVSVINHPEFSGDALVLSDGMVSISGVGLLSARGKTLQELDSAISEALLRRLRRPEVYVALKNPKQRLVHVLGVVQRPGAHSIKPGWRITEALSAAGGIMPGLENSDCRVEVSSGNSDVRETIPLTDVLDVEGSSNRTIADGDVITVRAVDSIPLYITGKVRAPGFYRLRQDNVGIVQAITLAGGLLPDAAASRITVTHLSGEVETVDLSSSKIDGKVDSEMQVRAGDLIYVPETSAQVAVMGWVNAPGVFAIPDNREMTLADAIGMARGSEVRRGGLKSVAIIRSDPSGGQERVVVNFARYMKTGDPECNPVLRDRDIVWVPETSKPDWDNILGRVSGGMSLLWMLKNWR